MTDTAAPAVSLDEKKRRLLALLMKEKGIDPAKAPVVPLPRGPEASFPLSFAQERLWVIDQLEPGNIAYNLPTALRLRGRLEPGVLARVFAEIVRRHETLRTTFGVASDGRPVQVISPPAPVPLPRIDLSGLPGAVREAELRRLAVEEGSRPFDLARGPVLRALLVLLGGEDHGLLLTVHHIASDGWSNGVLVGEVAALYDAFSHGRPSPLPELPVQYVDFAVWQRQAFGGEALERSLAWWRDRLDGAPVLTLPTDRPRPAVQGPGGSAVLVDLPAGLSGRLKGLGRDSGATLFMVVTAVFQALLSRLSGQTDLTVGMPVANRHKTEIEGLIGFFVNTLVLRADLGGDPPFTELLARVRQGSIEAFQHGEVPFSRIVEEVKPERSPSHSPLFQVMCALANTPSSSLEIPGLHFEYLEALLDSALFDLNLTLEDTPAGGAVSLEYRTELFDRSTALRLVGAYATVLEAVVENPGRRLSELPLLTPPERHALLVEWNDTAAEDAGESLEQALAAAAERHAEKTAIVFEGQIFTYREVEARARGLAERLRDLGVGPGSRVGLSAERSPEAVIGLLAILKAGAAYVPLDPAYSAERRAFMLEDSGATVLLTETSCSSVPPSVPPSVDVLAYLIYTSGSTGRPKGVAMTRRALANLLAWQEREALSGPARTLQFASLSFDVSFQEIASTWLSGGTLVLVSEEVRRDPFALLALLDRERVERLFLPFVALRQLAEAAESAGGGESLRDVVTAGEQLQVTRAVASWFARTGARLHNHYGPSESHVVTALALEGDPGSWPALPAIGRPIANTWIRLLDEGFELVPIGVPGELCIGGVALARGYLDRPELTAERFVPDPFGGAGERLYRTGDLARWRADGAIEYLGRRDGQVKIRGVRVEPGEVETALDAHPGVRGAVVVPSPEPASPGALRLVAFYVPAPGAEPSPAELRDFLAARLPAAIVPSLFVPLKAFPTTPSGKVDRRALVVEDGAGGISKGYVPPRTPAEELLAGLWSSLLGVGRVGVRDNFFELGGHSLLATQLVSRVREVFRVEIPQRALFEAPTVEELARRIEGASAGLFSPVEASGDGPYPLSFSQERLWLFDQIEPGNAAYNLGAALRFEGDLRPELLAAVLSEIVRRHATLRTSYEVVDGEPVQIVHEAAPLHLPVIDLAALPSREAEARRVAGEEVLRPFDLARGPVLRASLLRMGPGDHVLAFTMHHIATDGWSTGVLVREVMALYGGSPLLELPIRYVDYAAWQRRTFMGEALEEALGYWRERLQGIPVLELPTDRPRSAASSPEGAAEPLAVPAEVSEALKALGQRHGATVFMTLAAAFEILLLRYTGQTDFGLGTPVAGRNRVELESLIGFFVNTLVLRADLGGDPPFTEILARVREAALGAFAHQEMPFERLVEELNPERSLSHSPLFQVMFVLQNAPASSLEIPGLKATPFATEETAAKFDLSLAVADGEQGFAGGMEYRTSLFEAATVRRMLVHFGTLLAGIAAGPDRRLSELPLLPEAERHQVLAAWNPAGEPAPAGLLHDAFGEWADRAPDAPAVEAGGRTVTYGELRRRAHGLAHRLRSLGVGPEDRVAVCIERSADRVAAFLGVLEAGAAHVPFDPAHPRERLVYMTEDAGVRVAVASEATAEKVAGLGEVLVPGDGADAGPGQAIDPDRLAYVIYTSGSTGRPKGVLTPHRAAAHLVRQAVRLFGLGPGDRVLHAGSPGFDVSVLEIFAALSSGACLCPAGAELPSGPDLAAEMRERGITAAMTTPSVLASFGEGVDLPSLRALVLGAEKCPAGLARRWSEGRRFWNVYGPTESTIFVTLHEGAAGTQAPPIGRAIPGARACVLDPHGNPAPVGVPGELHIGGVSLARGYLGQPDRTAAAFVPDPWGGPGERLYRTGDLVRWLASGELDILGRIDRQVKVRGVRIEPEEIESALAGHPAVAECGVAVREDGAGPRLAAFFVSRGADGPAPEDLRGFLRERLPEAMVPSFFVPLPSLPLTPSGKLDRRALAKIAPEAGPSRPFEAPRTGTEAILADLWAEILGVPRVGVRDGFFELGGHSLLATRLVARIRQVFGAEIPLRALFEEPTVEALARRVEAAETKSVPPILPVPRDGRPLPLSFPQERLWFLDQLEPGNPTLNMPASYPLAGDVDPGVLARALSEVVRRHEVLRTTFGSEEGRPFQRIAPARPVPLPVVDLRGLGQEAERLEAEESLRPFDLARGPLLRACLLRRGERDWLLLLTLHHAVADGWSMGLLRRELGTLYAALSAGNPSPLPEPPVQYADYAAWQRRWLSGEVLEGQIAYWRDQLAGAPVLDLPTDRPRPALQTYRGESLLHVLPPDLSARLGALARSEGATLFMVLLAGLQALLSRLAGQDDVVVGSPVAGRVRTEVEGLIGCFLNHLALRTGLAGNPTFRELLGRARATALEAYGHQDVPFEKLLEELKPERDLSRTPIFQVFLNLLNLPAEGEEDGGADIADVHSKFDLTVYATPAASGLRLSLVYNADLFDRERVAEMAAQLEGLLAQAAADPEARTGSLSLLTPAARAVLPDPGKPLGASWQGAVHDALARHSPERVAVVEDGKILTYGDLQAAASGLAGLLAANGVGRGDVAAVWAHRSAALPGAVLGILRAGAAFLVLDPAYPASRLVDYLQIGRPRAFVVHAGAAPPPPEVEAELHGLACRVELPTDLPAGGPSVEVGPEDLAGITFTSGSTGRPKGVAGRHGPLTHFHPWMAERFSLSGEDRFGMLSALSHDPLQRDLFTPVWLGAALCVPDPERIGSPGYLADWVRRQSVTVLHLTPAMLEMLVQAAEETGAPMPSLRRAFVVGDLLKRSDVERLYRVAPGITCANLYGSTETQRSVSYFVIPREARTGREVLPLGRGMEDAQLLVLNPAGALAGIGELGEIHMRSPHLARGYLDDSALTAEKFLPDTGPPSPGGGLGGRWERGTGGEVSGGGVRLYRTGDLGRYRPDGEVEFAGRADAQVKIRGFRIEPGEIEAALARFPGVRESVVIVREDRPGDRRLVAYAVPRPGADLSPGEARAFLAERLPGSMVPADVVILPALPLTRTGKVDRRALPAPERTAGEGAVAPRTPVEETLAGLWRELLGVETVSVHDDFFDLGGHSLLATQLASRLRTAFGVELPLRALFERPTIAGLAELVAERKGDEGPAAPPLVPRPGTDDLPLSFSQQRLWFLHQLDPKSPAYNMYQALRLAGDLDEAALEAALRELVRRQTSLRTRFETRGARAVQAIGPVPGLLLPVIDLAALPEAVRDREGERITREESLRPFDLERGPVFRVCLLRLAPGERGLAIAMHHIVSDGWSMGLFVHELTALYQAFAAGRPSPLPPLPIRYADFAAWQREWLAGPVLEREAAWWRERLAGALAVLDLPLDRPRPPLLTFRGGRLARRMPAGAAEALLRLGREREATPFMTLLALFTALLLRHTGQEDVVVGSPVANRNRRETEGLIGFFVNTLVFRTDLSGAPGFRALVDRVRETALGAYTHQDLPFEKLVEEIAPERSLRHTPLFQVMFVVQSAPPEGSSPAEGLSLSVLNVENSTAKFDLTMIVQEAPGRLDVAFGYNADLFFPTTIHRLLAHCEALLAGVVAEPDRPVSAIPLLSEAERHQLFAEWNAAPSGPAKDASLHQLFFARAEERPDALALLSEEGAVTYGELAARALRLARRLQERGVGKEVPVGLLADRSPATIAGLLGILAAGGVYVPLDPSWPRERLAFVPADAGVRLVLTRGDLDDAEGEPWESIRVDPENAAYVIYTSGSTGTPNGVVVPHRGAVSLLRQARDHYGAGPESRVLQVASPGFDASILEIFLALGSGGALVQVRDEERLTPAVLAERLNALGVTTLVVTPAFLSVLPEPALKGVEAVSVGGEACPAPLAARWSPGRRFLNCYGPTEASIYATVEINAGREEGEPPIGRPVAGVQAFLLDADHQPVPLGVAGELCLGGAGLARGYLGQPGRTSAKFIPSPFSSGGERLYRTGDLARFRPDGRLEFLGRIDRQVKVRGVRIELGEIEAALVAHPQVEAAAAVAHGEGTDRFLAAYAVLSEPAPSPAELRRFLAESLPDAMVPAAVVPLPALPLTPSGKVDRRALPVPGRAETGGVAVAPRNELESVLAELWKEALGVPGIGIHDDFFELGGTSIKAAILTNLLEERLGEPVYVVALFDAPTIARLTVYLETHYPATVARITGEKTVEEGSAKPAARIREETAERFRDLIPPLPPVAPAAPRNPRAVFLLSPPRSGSTLLRVMLAGNPVLFAPPELELLGFNTLRERKAAFSGRYSFWAEGTVRAIMEIEGCGSEQAWQIMADAEERDLSVRDFYREIQERTGGRLLVDKTPSYSLDRTTLERAEADFEEPLYIHLLRHPYGMISSFEKARLEQVFFRVPHPFSRRELAELIWLTSQRNILAFLSGIEPGRQLRLRFEDLVQDPRAAMERVCAFLGVPFVPAMLDPYEDTGRRMTDGIHALSRMVGDVKFHEHKAIDPAVAESWKKEIGEDFLGEPTWRMAESLGYRRKKTAPSLVRLQPKGDRPPLVAVHPVGGNVLAYTELARELMPGGRPLWALQSAGLVGGEPHRRIETMASAYVEEVLAARPAGPYPLLGWSLGGSIAFEMARQLGQRGHEVPLLVLADALAPGTLSEEELEAVDDAGLLAGIAGDLAGVAGREALVTPEELRALPDGERIPFLLRSAERAGALPTGLGAEPARVLLSVYQANLEAARHYRPEPWPGRALLLRARRPEGAPDSGWGSLVTGGVEVVEIEGDHYSLLRSPRVARLAREIEARLE